MTSNDTDNPTTLPLLDERALEQIAEGLSAEILAELLGSFIDDLKQRIAAIEQARADGGLQSLAEHAHALKSSTGSYGARRLQHHCTELEQQARAGASEQALATAAIVRDCGQETIQRYTERISAS